MFWHYAKHFDMAVGSSEMIYNFSHEINILRMNLKVYMIVKSYNKRIKYLDKVINTAIKSIRIRIVEILIIV